ncbi:hypothetical protein ACHAPJ_009074 [Fusarium lateritium]
MEQTPSQEVSGQAVFWILSTLAVAVVAQPSANSRITDRVLLGGKIDLLRCFPGICLLDAFIDLFVLYKGFRPEVSVPKPGYPRRHRVPQKTGTLMAKLALSILIVFPLTVKALSMSGVPATQSCAFIFFFANMTNLVVELCNLETDELFLAEGEHFKDAATLLLALTALGQMFFEYWIWWRIGPSTSFHLPANVDNICKMVQALCALFMIIQVIIWVIRFFIYRNVQSSVSPNMIPMHLVIGSMSILGAVRGRPMPRIGENSGVALPPDWKDNLIFANGLCLSTMLFSNILAKMLETLWGLVTGSDIQPSTPMRQKSSTEEKEIHNEVVSGPSGFRSLLRAFAHWIWTSGTRIDNYIIQLFDVHTRAGFTISLGIFSLVTTACYYLVWFDGTGTVNPDWTSIVG